MINREKLQAAGINVEEGIHRMGGQESLYERFLNSFLDNPYYQKMLDAMECKDVEAAFQSAHALKGMAGNMSMTELFEAMVPLVEEFRAKSMVRALELYEPVRIAYEKIEIVMK